MLKDKNHDLYVFQLENLAVKIIITYNLVWRNFSKTKQINKHQQNLKINLFKYIEVSFFEK